MRSPPLYTRLMPQQDAFALYHIVQEAPQSHSSGPALPALGHALAGAIGTASSKLLLYPLDLVVTRLQVQHQLHGPREAPSAAQDADAEYTGLVDAVRKIYDGEGGLKAFYTGCAPDIGKGIADSFLFFLSYTFLRQLQLRREGSKDLPVLKELGVGILAGSFSKLLTTPIQNIVTRQQTAAMVAARDPTSTVTASQSDQLSMRDIALQIRHERGIQGFWAGYSASMILTLNPALTFAVDNLLRNLLPKSQRKNPPTQLTFLIAACSKAIATAVTYPVMLAKSRAQVSRPTSITEEEGTVKSEFLGDSSKPTTRKSAASDTTRKALRLLSAQYAILLSLRKIYREEGLQGLYSGLQAEVLKGFLSHGLTMVVKDKVHVAVIQLYYLLLKLSKRWPGDLEKMQEEAKTIGQDAQQQAVAVGKDVQQRAVAMGKDAQQRAVTVGQEAQQRAENVGVTVVEGAKSLVQHGRDALNGKKE